MQDHPASLFLSPLPVPVWAVAALWLLVHGLSLGLAARTLRLAATEQHIVVPASAQPQLTRRSIAIQTVCGIAVFVYSQFAGGALASFFAGGWFLAAALGAALNVRSLLLLRARSMPGSLRGKVDISNEAALMERAADLWAGALWCLLAAIVFPQPALPGAAFILGSGAFKLMRRARPTSKLTTA
ncbi:hypothetical protein [Rhizobacter sp. P5_C2]